MKQTGVVRKIDELGRIVLPKEIRRNLGIRDGENLEIFVTDNGVYLQKFSKLLDLESFGSFLCQDILDYMGLNVFILDRDMIVSSSILDIKGQKIISFFEGLLMERENYESKQEESFWGLKGYFLVRPVIVFADCLGLIVLYKESCFADYERRFLNFLVQLFIRKIEI